VIYGGVSPERIERILKEHVIGGLPIEDWVVGRNRFGGEAPVSRTGDHPRSDSQP
jgi:(2Fe-2S) ferredoxin